MLSTINKEDNKKYIFILQSSWIDKININDKNFSNDIYEKYNATLTNLSGELIICSDLTKLDIFCKKIISETYEEYEDFISKRNFNKEQWIYNILDNIAEQDKILYKDDLIVIIPNYIWDGGDIYKMYLLVFPMDKTLHSLRDLTSNHIDLLYWIKKKTLEIIKLTYNFNSDQIKIFIHYAPSSYHLHIHFVLITNNEVNSSVEYSHDIDTIIQILKIKSDYYQTIIMNKRI